MNNPLSPLINVPFLGSVLYPPPLHTLPVTSLLSNVEVGSLWTLSPGVRVIAESVHRYHVNQHPASFISDGRSQTGPDRTSAPPWGNYPHSAARSKSMCSHGSLTRGNLS